VLVVDVADLRESPAFEVDLSRVEQAAAAVLEAEGHTDTQLSVAVVDDPHMADLHQRFSGIPGATDVLAFPLGDGVPGSGPDGPPPLLGEIVVSADTAAREASERGVSTERELLLYVMHGTLHLLGYDDHDPHDRERMHLRQETLLCEFMDRPGRLSESGALD
jgi:probable rRNA maturation factor